MNISKIDLHDHFVPDLVDEEYFKNVILPVTSKIGLGVPQLSGFLFENHHIYTYNMNAISKKSPFIAIKDDPGSRVDVKIINFHENKIEQQYQLKNNGTKQASKTALTHPQYTGLKLVGPFQMPEYDIDNKIQFGDIASIPTTYPQMIGLAESLKTILTQEHKTLNGEGFIPDNKTSTSRCMRKSLEKDQFHKEEIKTIRKKGDSQWQIAHDEHEIENSKTIDANDQGIIGDAVDKDENQFCVKVVHETLKEHKLNTHNKLPQQSNLFKLDGYQFRLQQNSVIKKALKTLEKYGEFPYTLDEIKQNETILTMLNAVATEVVSLIRIYDGINED